MADDWTRQEVEATVADYFAMLLAELRGESFNKSAHRRALLALLDDRTPGAVERKHQNISAILRDLGCPFIDGYKPLGNYQKLLHDVVADRLRSERSLVDTIRERVEAPVAVQPVPDVLSLWEEPPDAKRGIISEPKLNWKPKPRRGTDYLAIEARNRSLGLAGEELVLEFEAKRLHRAGQKKLAARVEQVSRTVGDGLGYDVLSFESNGRERLIEVKTTSFGRYTPFYVTPTELACSLERSRDFQLYRVFGFRKQPRLFAIGGALDKSFRLEASEYRAKV